MGADMSRIQVGGAGGAPSNGFIKSLKDSNRNDYIIGTSSSHTDLFLAKTDEKYLVPLATSPDYHQKILSLLAKTKPDLLHLQNDYEVKAISQIRDQVTALGVKLYLPAAKTIAICVDKQQSYEIWQSNQIRVPKTLLISNESDLKKAFSELGEKIWIRAVEGAAGRGSLPTANYEFAKIWIDQFSGWGTFSAAELLSENTVTWLSIWHQGELVVAQTRRRLSWNFANRALSGVTGITGVGETHSDETVNRVALDSIMAIDQKPHGIFAVDMTYDQKGFPNPTEINIGRFFTTHYFFTKAGLNMPEIFCDIALENNIPTFEKKINPLEDELLWIRGMDSEPVLTTRNELEKMYKTIEEY